MTSSIHYTITPGNPNAHIFSVSVTVYTPDSSGQKFSLPAWIPGSYMIRDFAKNISQLVATDENGTQVTIKQLDKQTWQCEPCKSALTIKYNVYAWDLSVRTAHLDQTHGFFNGTSVFVELHNIETDQLLLTINPPPVDGWQVATACTPEKIDKQGFGRYVATDYDELIDHPVEMGTFKRISFDVKDTPHEMILTGDDLVDDDRLSRDLVKICSTHIDMFGELPNMDKYLFLTMVTADGYGGLEHRSSTALLCARKDLPRPGKTDMNEDYRGFLGLCSHEYFHTWNVKRIKPEAYLPYKLAQESYTEQLWAFEGITSYYDDLGLVRSGVITPESYLELLGQMITRVIRGSGREKQSVADSSFNTWTKFYKQDESAPNPIVSYYAKGALIALALDLTIRQHSGHEKSLDDVMRKLWQDYGKTGKGVPEKQIEHISSDIAGTDLSEFFNRFLYNTEDPPLDELLRCVGISYSLRPMLNADDKGGKQETIPENHPYLGARIVNNSAGACVTHVFENSSAENAGLAAGDIIVAVNNLKVDKSSFDTVFNRNKVNDTITVHAFRRDELMTLSLVVQSAPVNTCVLTWHDDQTDEINKNKASWLHIKPA